MTITLFRGLICRVGRVGPEMKRQLVIKSQVKCLQVDVQIVENLFYCTILKSFFLNTSALMALSCEKINSPRLPILFNALLHFEQNSLFKSNISFSRTNSARDRRWSARADSMPTNCVTGGRKRNPPSWTETSCLLSIFAASGYLVKMALISSIFLVFCHNMNCKSIMSFSFSLSFDMTLLYSSLMYLYNDAYSRQSRTYWPKKRT